MPSYNSKCIGCGSFDPCGCADPGNLLKPTSEIKYIGPNLPGTGIQTCDDLTTVIQKIDNQILLIKELISPTPSTTTTTTTTT